MYDLSVVVTTRDRAYRLQRSLDAFLNIQSDRPWELVLVDNASADGTPSLLTDFAESTTHPVTILQEPVPGLGRALNTGVRGSSARYIATTDDDCYPRPDYVDAVLSVFEQRQVDFMGGRVLRHDESDAPVAVVERESPELLPAHSFPYTGFVTGANLAFTRILFDAIGGFDALLGAGTPFPAEDIDFCARASDRGWRGGFFPEPTVYHDHGRRPGRAAERLNRAYDRGRGAYYAKTLVDYSSLRMECIKRWYWGLAETRPGQTRRELIGALHYLLHRIWARLS